MGTILKYNIQDTERSGRTAEVEDFDLPKQDGKLVLSENIMTAVCFWI